MRAPLQKFTHFAGRLLPHETQFLLAAARFEDAERTAILERVDYNARHIDQFRPYDTDIDKRKYHHLSRWIESRLRQADVDEHFSWMLQMEERIITDRIELSEEKQLILYIRRYKHPSFYFPKFYELVDRYHDFLQIRFRYNDQQLVADFLARYQAAYEKYRAVSRKMRKVTADVVSQYRGETIHSRKWLDWLQVTFYDESLDGHTRYHALVRLVFISYNYREYEQLVPLFDYLDRLFARGQFYSRRLLTNYYSNRLLLHAGLADYDLAVNYGYLSVRSPTHDHLFYVNNLCAVLLRLDKKQEALQLVQQSAAGAKATKNMHSRIGFAAFQMQAFKANGMYQQAVQQGDVFLTAYDKEILRYRWYLFFSVYLEALLEYNKAAKLIKIVRKYRLLEREQDHLLKSEQPPFLAFCYQVAIYKEGNIQLEELTENLRAHGLTDGGNLNEINPWTKKSKSLMRWVPQLAGDLLRFIAD